ncbi:WW domain-containing protein [Schistosoma japonicum]|nr:WW domain-containing protein [Schistosoma japonicum]
MPALSPLEFRDCVVDSPNFRKALSDHEADLKTANRKVKSVLVNTRRVFEAMESLNQAFIDYAASLKDFSEYAHQSTYISQPENGTFLYINQRYILNVFSEVCETDDDITIKNALSVYATIIGNVEEARRTMIQPNKEVVLNELSELRSLWLGGQNTNAKSFQKETKNFCQYLEKYASIKSKEFTEDISLIMRMLSNFYYQAFEQFKDSSHQISQILRAAQRSSENYEQISLESKTLTEKLLNTPWEQIQSTNLSDTREGYVFVATKKAVVTVWTKNFCTYNRNSKILKLTPYTQYQDTDNALKMYAEGSIYHFRNRFSDIPSYKVFYYNLTSPITLQAQCLDDLHEWLLVMDGKEPIYEDRRTCIQESDNIELNDKTYEFLNNLIYAIEKIGIQAEGIYRTCGLKSKVSGLIKQALSPSGISKTALLNNELCVLTGALKCFIRQLETPIMTFQLHDSFMSAMKRDHTYRLTELSALLKLLPQENQRTLDLLIRHLSRSQNMFTSSNWEKYSSQTSLQSFQSSTCTSSFSTPPPPTTTASKSQSSSTSSSSLPIAIQIVHDNEYISSQHEQNSTNEKVLNHHPSLSTTTSPYFHLHHHLIDPPPKLRVPQRVSPNPSIHLTVPHSFKKPPPPPPPTPTLSVPSKYVNTMPVTCLSLKPPTFTQTSITTSATIASTTNSSSFISENFRSTHNLSDECKDLFS